MSGNKVWITGASSGIGKALCEEYARNGWQVLLSSRRKEALENVMKTLSGANHQLLPLDLADTDSLKEKCHEAWNRLNGIDLIIHSGGISQRGLAIDTPLSVDRRVMEIDFFGTVELTKHLLPQMIDQGHGHVAVITSLVGKFGTPYRSAYAAAKHALHGYFDSLRAEVHDKNIAVSLVMPGFIRTNVSVNALTESGQKLNQMDDAQANGMSPERCAAIIYSGLQKKKREFLIGGKEKYGVYVKRFFPGVFARMIRKMKVR